MAAEFRIRPFTRLNQYGFIFFHLHAPYPAVAIGVRPLLLRLCGCEVAVVSRCGAPSDDHTHKHARIAFDAAQAGLARPYSWWFRSVPLPITRRNQSDHGTTTTTISWNIVLVLLLDAKEY
jgi:hypothetical protein